MVAIQLELIAEHGGLGGPRHSKIPYLCMKLNIRLYQIAFKGAQEAWMHIWLWMRATLTVSGRVPALAGSVRLSIAFMALPCNQLGLRRDARNQLIQPS